jgi:hypothetical protein
MALTIERKKGAVQVYDLMQFGSQWKLRRGRQDVVAGSGLEVVLFLREVPRSETLVRMWDEHPVTVSKAIERINFADWSHAS